MSVNVPNKMPVPFANAGLKNTIPPTSDNVNGFAGYNQGFPPINMTPKTAGGIPPFGQDMNGILFAVTEALRFSQAGSTFVYDSTFATAIGGYRVGALVQRTDGNGFWLNLTDGNTVDPESAGAAAAGWVPEFTYGIATVTMTNANVTLTPLQYGRPIIVITGALTGDLNLIFPSIVGDWVVINNTTGSFSITCKTASGTGGIVSQGGSPQQIYGDGTNIIIPAINIPQGSYSSNAVVTAGTTFTIADVGKAIEINAIGATSHNLPAASTYASGKAISFANINTGIATFNRAGSDTITGGNLVSASAIPLNNGETVTLVSDGVNKWYVAASNVTFFGAPQTWQSVTRVVGTTYTNSTGRKISVFAVFSGAGSSGQLVSVSINGSSIGNVTQVANNGVSVQVTFDVPSGATYLFSAVAGVAPVSTCSELR